MRKNDAFVAKIANTRLTKIFKALFALAERLPTFASLCLSVVHNISVLEFHYKRKKYFVSVTPWLVIIYIIYLIYRQ